MADSTLLDLFELLDDDCTLPDNLWQSDAFDAAIKAEGASQQPIIPSFQQSCQYTPQLAQTLEVQNKNVSSGAPGLDQAPHGPLAESTPEQVVTTTSQGQPAFMSPTAAAKYADTAALVAAAQAQMDAASPGHRAQLQLQHVVSATSVQLQEMARAAFFAGKATGQHWPATSGMGGAVSTHPPQPPQQQGTWQHQLQQQLHQQPQQPQQHYQQQQQQQQFHHQQQHQQQQQEWWQEVQPQQQQQQQRQAPVGQVQQRAPARAPVSAATLAKAAMLSGKTSSLQAATPASLPPAQPSSAAVPNSASMQGFPAMQLPGLSSAFTGAFSTGLDSAAAASAAAAVSQQQGLGLALPAQFQGVMLTPAGAVTGVAVGPNLMHWVQGLQHLASQQQQVQAQRRVLKAARKNNKVADLQAELVSKQEQLQVLSLENMALAAKARALEQLVESAGDDVNLMQEQLATLSLRQDSQEESQKVAAAAAAAVEALQGNTVQQPQPLFQPQPQPQQQQQHPPPPPQQQGPQFQGRAQPQFKQLHRQVLTELMNTPLDSLEDILGGLAPSTAGAAPAAAAAPGAAAGTAPTGLPGGPSPTASTAIGGYLQSMPGGTVQQQQQMAGQQLRPQQQEQQQDQLSPQQLLYQQWSPQHQQQRPGVLKVMSPGQGLIPNMAPSSSFTSQGTQSSSGIQEVSEANSVDPQSSTGDISSPLAARSASTSSDRGLQGDLLGTAAHAAAAAQAAATGTGGGLLLAGRAEDHRQLYEAAAMAYTNVLRRQVQPLQEKLPEIQALHKRVVLQLMPLLLQVQQERLQHNMQSSGAGLWQQQQQQQQLMQTPAMQHLTRVMLQYSQDIHTFAIANRVSTYELYTLNIETGILGQPPPDGHWQRVASMLKDRLSPQALADLCVARQLYSSTLMRIKQQRQLLVLQLAQVISTAHSRSTTLTYRTDAVFQAEAGPHCEGMQVLDVIETNMRKEYTLEGVYQWMTHHIMPMEVLAELVVHSYPYKADIHMTLQELMKDQPMPALTALQQLQLKQLQEQQDALQLQQQQQQQAALLVQQQQAATAATVLAQQQQAAERLQALQQQRTLLTGGSGGLGPLAGLML